jgi:hypothetical protein
MLSGKAVARAVRAQFLVDSALNAIATSQMFGIPVPKMCEDQPVESSSSSNDPDSYYQPILKPSPVLKEIH